MDSLNYLLIRQAHIVWIASIVNIGIGMVIPDFDFVAKSISHVGLEAPVYAFIHRSADIVIGLSMCLFAFGIQRLSDNRYSAAALSIFFLGMAMISAGIWTLETPLHLLYNLSIFMIVMPILVALEFKTNVNSKRFENVCVLVALMHVSMFWLILAGFIPQEINGLVQRIWAIPTMGWFGYVAFYLLQSFKLEPNESYDVKQA